MAEQVIWTKISDEDNSKGCTKYWGIVEPRPSRGRQGLRESIPLGQLFTSETFAAMGEMVESWQLVNTFENLMWQGRQELEF